MCVCVCAHARSSIHVHVYNSNFRGCGISNFFLVLISEDLACYMVVVIKKIQALKFHGFTLLCENRENNTLENFQLYDIHCMHSNLSYMYMYLKFKFTVPLVAVIIYQGRSQGGAKGANAPPFLEKMRHVFFVL